MSLFPDVNTTLDLNGPELSFTTQPQDTSTSTAEAYSGTTTSLIQVSYNGYPVRGYLYYPTSLGSSYSLDVVVLYHGTITSEGVSPANAASTFINIALNKVNLKDKLVFSVAYPQDAIPAWEANRSLPAQQFPGLDYSTFRLGDNIVYAEAALLWVKNSLGSYLSSNNIPKSVNKVYTFGHSQGAYLVHRLNTLHSVDGVISNAPGPIDFLDRCSGSANVTTLSCNKVRVGFGTTGAAPDAYNSRSLKSFITGTLSPTLFTQALDDEAYQVNLMQNTFEVGLDTCTDCAETTFNYYGTGGHDAFVTNAYVQRDIRNFVGSVGAGIATFVGVATATFPSDQSTRSTNTGSIAYQWYKDNTALSDGANVTGSGTTVLSLSGLTNTDDNQSNIFLRADYTPSAYESGLTPNAFNEPIDSDTGIVTVLPIISITTQPEDSTVVEDVDTTFSIVASTSDSTDSNLSYNWYLNGSSLSDGSLVSGSKTNTLTIQREEPALSKVYCEVSHPTAQPGIVTSTEAKLDVFSARALINYEKFGNAELYETGSRDIGVSGGLIFPAVVERSARLITLWSSEKDVDVKITLGAAAGTSVNDRRGGQGGISVFKMTMKKDTEYTVKLGVAYEQGGGARGGINGANSGGGGGLAVIYEKARVIAVCGGGGGAGQGGRGGDGGGCNVAGEHGQNGANPGAYVPIGELPSTGMTQAGRTGPQDFDNDSSGSGRLSGCTIGKYYFDQGLSPCDDISTDKVIFRRSDGFTYSNTLLYRGYKTGQGHRNNGGKGFGNGGAGGAGARGGEGVQSGEGGGGGASGYHSGQIELLSSSILPNGTQLGGNTSNAFVSIERYIATDDHVPLRPDNTGNSRTVTFTVTREASNSNTITISKQSGTGPDEIIFGPNGNNVTAQISSGAVYTVTQNDGTLRLSGNTLQLEDSTDNDYDDLQVTPDNGTFTSDSRYEANW